jgi:hypothetical protein
MYPVIRLEKLHPDGSPRRIGRGYLLDEVEGITRVYTPVGTRFWHVNGVWTTETAWISAFRGGWQFVVHRSFPPGHDGFYVDVAREVRIADGVAAFIDLYVDVLAHRGRIWEKDHEKLSALSAEEAATTLAIATDVRGKLARGEHVFHAGHRVWDRPVGAAALPPLHALAL